MNINIKTIPQDQQRYQTIGDYFDKDGVTNILVSEMGNEDYEFMISVHELVEQYLCKKRGISEESITNFDVNNLDLEDPGSSPLAPYHKEHMFALIIEGMLANQLDIDFTYEGKYNNTLGEVCPCIKSEKIKGENNEESKEAY